MADDNDILLKVIAQDEYSAQLKKAKDAVAVMSKDQIDALKKTAEEQKKATAAAKAHADQMQKLGQIAKGAAIAGIGALAAAVTDSIKETMDYNKSIRDLAQNLAITTEETSRIVQTADDFTVSQEKVTAALQMAVKKGMAPSIETLARMADEYNALSSPTERAARMAEVFGRDWTALTPMLKEGGRAIREAAAAQDDALIVTEAQSKATRDLEKNLDNLGDKVTALKLKVGNALVPVLNEAATAFGYLTDGIGSADARENELSAALAQSVAMFGEHSEAVNYASTKLREYLTVRQQVGMTEQETALRTNMAASASARAGREAAANAAQMMSVEQTFKTVNAAIGEATTAYERHNAVVDQFKAQSAASEAALVTYRAGISETIGRIDAMSQSLVGMNDVQAKQALAQASLEAIRTAQEAGTISQEQAQKATGSILLQYGLATEKTLAMASAQQAVTDAFLQGDLPLQNFVDSAGKIPDIAKDGKVAWSELNELGLKPASTSIKDLQTYAQTLKDAGITPLTGEMKTLQKDGLEATETKAKSLKNSWRATMDDMKTVALEDTNRLKEILASIPSVVPVEVRITTTGSLPTGLGGTTPTPTGGTSQRTTGATGGVGGAVTQTSNRTMNMNTTINAGGISDPNALSRAFSQRMARQLRAARAVS